MSVGRPKTGKLVPCGVCCREKYYPLSAIKRGAQYCSSECSVMGSRGRHVVFTQEQCRKISENHADVSGRNNPNWRGGIACESLKFRNRHWKQLLEWKKVVLGRDLYKCKGCGAVDRLEIHHIISVAECRSTAFLPMNGVTLCRDCHEQTDNYGSKATRLADQWRNVIGKTKCIARTIPHKYQAYDTVGNWGWTDDGILVIFVSDMDNTSYESLVLVHEQIEAWLCLKRGITQESVDEFDKAFEENRVDGNTDEPGHDPSAPYHREHVFAEKIERLVADELGIVWEDYDRTVTEL